MNGIFDRASLETILQGLGLGGIIIVFGVIWLLWTTRSRDR